MTAKIIVFRDVMPCSYLRVYTEAHNTAYQKAVISSSS